MEIVAIDSFVPDHAHSCENCGQKPVVTGIKDGKTVYQGTLCGPCNWGDASALDPESWNQKQA